MILKNWNRCFREAAEPPSLEVLRMCLSPEQPAIADPALSNRIGLDDFQSCLSTSLNSYNKLDLKSTLQSPPWVSR